MARRIAISVWNGRIAPVFDVSRTALLVDLDATGDERCVPMALAVDSTLCRVEQLVERRVSMLVCGAISGDLEHSLTQAGIFVTAFVAGEVEHVLRELLAGDFTSPSLCMPGTRQRRKNMPGRDGTGPLGQGAMTGGGRGWCSGGGGGRGAGRGQGQGRGQQQARGMGRGAGRGRGFGPWWRLDQEASGGAESLAQIADRMSEVLRELENRVAKLEEKKGEDDQ